MSRSDRKDTFIFNLEQLFVIISSKISFKEDFYTFIYFSTILPVLVKQETFYVSYCQKFVTYIFFSVTNEFHCPVRDKKKHMATLTHACRRICAAYCFVENNYVRASRKVEKSLGEISLFLSIFAWATAVIRLWFISIHNRAL